MNPVSRSVVKPAPTILVVDDEYLIRWTLETDLVSNGFQVVTASTCAEAWEAVNRERPDLVLLDLKLPDGDGMTLLGRMKAEHPDLLVIMITANGQVEIAVEAMRRGAHDFFPKPFQVEEVRHRVEQALETVRLRREVDLLRSQQKDEWGIDRIIGSSPPMLRVLEMVRKIGASEATTILLQGESGTGKDLLAKAIHASGTRRDQAFLAINCSAVPATLLESELFGHEKGAFTDARQMKKGLFELADGGTLLLDEIGTMRLDMQSKLLRVLEERNFRRVGGTKDIKVDVRIIAATNADLESEKEKGNFRADLFYRLNVVPVTLPPCGSGEGTSSSWRSSSWTSTTMNSARASRASPARRKRSSSPTPGRGTSGSSGTSSSGSPSLNRATWSRRTRSPWVKRRTPLRRIATIWSRGSPSTRSSVGLSWKPSTRRRGTSRGPRGSSGWGGTPFATASRSSGWTIPGKLDGCDGRTVYILVGKRVQEPMTVR